VYDNRTVKSVEIVVRRDQRGWGIMMGNDKICSKHIC
jgi:hypothetical protein